jgi:hypothetical protein
VAWRLWSEPPALIQTASGTRLDLPTTIPEQSGAKPAASLQWIRSRIHVGRGRRSRPPVGQPIGLPVPDEKLPQKRACGPSPQSRWAHTHTRDEVRYSYGSRRCAAILWRRFRVHQDARGPEEWHSQPVTIQFEGVYRDAIVFLNGEFAAQRPYGYSNFYVPVDAFLTYGGAQHDPLSTFDGDRKPVLFRRRVVA